PSRRPPFPQFDQVAQLRLTGHQVAGNQCGEHVVDLHVPIGSHTLHDPLDPDSFLAAPCQRQRADAHLIEYPLPVLRRHPPRVPTLIRAVDWRDKLLVTRRRRGHRERPPELDSELAGGLVVGRGAASHAARSPASAGISVVSIRSEYTAETRSGPRESEVLVARTRPAHCSALVARLPGIAARMNHPRGTSERGANTRQRSTALSVISGSSGTACRAAASPARCR